MTVIDASGTGLLDCAPDITDVVSESGFKAFWYPTQKLMSDPTALRHAPSKAFLKSACGRVWVLSIKERAWSIALLRQCTTFLSDRGDSLAWPDLQEALCDHLEVSVSLHNASLLTSFPEAFECDKLAGAVLRRWMAAQTHFSNVENLREIQSALQLAYTSQVEKAFEAFMRELDPAVADLLESQGIPLNIYNYLMNPVHGRVRVQFYTVLPILGRGACLAGPKGVMRQLRTTVDAMKSYEKLLCSSLNIRPSAIRALRHVGFQDVGAHFADHPLELLGLLDAQSAENRPKSPKDWEIFLVEYITHKKVFMRSTASNVLLKAKLGLAMSRSHRKSKRAIPSNDHAIQCIERLRAGIFQSVLAFNQARNLKGYLQPTRRASIGAAVDHFLGALSWGRLLELSSTWDTCLADAIGKKQGAIDFLTGKQYFDFLPNGKFVAPNGCVVRCLLTMKELSAQGVDQGICLATSSHRIKYHERCVQGSIAIMAIQDGNGNVKSTVHFDVVHLKVTDGREFVSFNVVQHSARMNAVPELDSILALAALKIYLRTAECVSHALAGAKINAQRVLKERHSSIDPSMLAAGMDAFHATFGARSEELLANFLKI